jgi:hypothetical protein
MRLKYLITILVNILFNLNWIISQCIPPSSDKCEDANIICSLDELNGYTGVTTLIILIQQDVVHYVLREEEHIIPVGGPLFVTEDL